MSLVEEIKASLVWINGLPSIPACIVGGIIAYFLIPTFLEYNCKEALGVCEKYISMLKTNNAEITRELDKIKNITTSVADLAGEKFPKSYIANENSTFSILEDIPLEIETLFKPNPKNFSIKINSYIFNNRQAEFTNDNAKTKFMYRSNIYTIKIEPVKYDRVKIIVDIER